MHEGGDSDVRTYDDAITTPWTPLPRQFSHYYSRIDGYMRFEKRVLVDLRENTHSMVHNPPLLDRVII